MEREGREGFSAEQLDLFAWRERNREFSETIGRGERRFDPPPPNRTEPQDVAAITREALLGALEAQYDDPTVNSRDFVALITEVERRREARAAPLLVRVCRRYAGFDRSRAMPEVLAALKALAATGVADAAPVIMRLTRRESLGILRRMELIGGTTRPAAAGPVLMFPTRDPAHSLPVVRARAASLGLSQTP